MLYKVCLYSLAVFWKGCKDYLGLLPDNNHFNSVRWKFLGYYTQKIEPFGLWGRKSTIDICIRIPVYNVS